MDDKKYELSPHIRPVPKYLTERESHFQPGADQLETMRARSWSLQDYVRTTVKYRWLIGLIAGSIILVTALYSFLATPMFTASAILKISTYSPSIHGVSMEDTMQQQSRELDYVNTQIESLSSLSLADKVLSSPEVQTDLNSYLNRKTGVFSIFGVLKSLFGKTSEAAKPGDNTGAYSQPVRRLNSYLRLISVAPVRKTSLVKVSATTADRLLSAKLANIHAEMFIEHVREERQKNSMENLVFLKGQAEELAGKVALAERKLASYAEENAIVSLNKDDNIVVDKMTDLNKMMTEAISKRIKSEKLYEEAKSGSGQSSSAYDDESVRQIRVELKQAEAEYASLGGKFKPSYPKMVQLHAKIASLRTTLKEQRNQAINALEAQYKTDIESEKEFKEQLERQKSEAFELSRRLVQYNILKREFESVKDLHQSVLRQLKEAQVSAESTGSNISISDKAAIPQTHSSPARMANILLALIFGPIIAFGVVLVIESLDRTINTPEDVQHALQLPALGIVPMFTLEDPSMTEDAAQSNHPRLSPSPLYQEAEDDFIPDSLLSSGYQAPISKEVALVPDHDLVTVNAPRSIASESFRTIRTGILLSSADHPPRVILITSAKKSEGKTTVITNLAVTLAQQSSKTIIIDGDLRRPSLHKMFQIDNNHPGLVDYLTGQKDLSQVIMKTPVPDLSIIPAGPIPPNPAELIGSKKMAALLEKLAEEYQYVLIDTPPVMPVSDAIGLSRIVDGVVLVVRGQETQRQIAQEATLRLRRVGAKILGVVLNDVDFKSGDYYYYYKDTYSYYYAEEELGSRRRRRKTVATGA